MRVTPALPPPPSTASDKLGSWSPRERLNPSPGSKTGPGVCVKTRKPIRAENERQWRCESGMETDRQDAGWLAGRVAAALTPAHQSLWVLLGAQPHREAGGQ